VLLGDDLIDHRDVLLSRMIEVHDTSEASVIALMEVPPEAAHLYGIATVEKTDQDDVVKVTGLVEKPAVGTQLSNFAVIGRYILRPEVFGILEHTSPGSGGEIQLTDALNTLATDTIAGGVQGVIFSGRRYDTGDRLDYLKAIVQVAASRDDLGPDFVEWLHTFIAKN
jgi:UTP--glucose-1-phosphate uridylyltransferase